MEHFFGLVKEVFDCDENFSSNIRSIRSIEEAVNAHRYKSLGSSLLTGKNGVGSRFARGKFIYTVFYSNGHTKTYPQGAEVKHDCIIPYSLHHPSRCKKILYVQLHSINHNVSVNRTIPRHIKTNIGARCIICGTTADIIPDHKDGLYKTQALSAEEFQPLCLHCNFVKRERYKKYGATGNSSELSVATIPFLAPLVKIFGSEISELCFWEDPLACMGIISEKILRKMKNRRLLVE